MLLNQDWIYFLKSAELGSYSKAAHSLNISQGAISQAVQRLENVYGILLFERGRGKSRLKITPTGTDIYNNIKDYENQFENELLPKAKGLKIPLKIACVASIANRHLLPLLSQPNNCVYHVYIIPRYRHIMTGVSRNHFDLTLFSGPIDSLTTEIFCDDLYYVIGKESKYKSIETISSYSELKKLINLFERRPFDNKWSNVIPVIQSGFFLDDHFTGRELILGGHGIAPYSLYYFSLDELNTLAISPAIVNSSIFREQWKLQALFDCNSLNEEQLEDVFRIIKSLKITLKRENKNIKKLLNNKWK